MTTYYVDGVNGSDANAGTSEGSGNAWATVDKAMNTVVAGDIVYIKGNGTYNETATLDTVGAYNNPTEFIGYTTTPGDNGKCTITGPSSYSLTTTQTGNCYYIFRNIICTGNTSAGVWFSNADKVTWVNCEFTSNGGHGCYADNQHAFINCVAHSNSQSGIYVDQNTSIIGCIAYSNSQHQIRSLTTDVCYKNLVYGLANSASYFGIDVGSLCTSIIGNTVDGEGLANSQGIDNDTSVCWMIDNIIYDCNLGIKTLSDNEETTWGTTNNLLNSNTTDYTATFALTNLSVVTTAPAFTSEATDDYTLGEASPAIGAGLVPGGVT
jgi:hypothetical protein